jgi:peptidyl-prolyl cis-trans isomerase C
MPLELIEEIMKKWLKEPLLHFLVIGALIFVVFSTFSTQEISVDEKKIVVSTGDIERLAARWVKTRNRPPTETELKGLVDSYIREEVYYREALALGLDQNDTVLRRRLMQKMEYLSQDIAELNTPDQAALNAYFLAHKDKYELPARVSFTHIYFNFDKRGRQIVEDAKSVLAEIQAATSPDVHTPDLGDQFMMQYTFTLETPFQVARLFGQGFAEQLFELVTNGWKGPIESGYGLHLVRINEKIDARMPELASVIDKVRTDWMSEQRQKTNKEIYERFKERYEIVVEKMPDKIIVEEATVSGEKSS